MIDILKNVSKITSIPKTQLEEVMTKMCLCIAHETIDLVDDIDNDTVCVDIGIGTLQMRYFRDEITYKFIPSNQLEKLIIQAIKTGQSPITDACEKEIVERVLTTYKELL